MVAFVTSSETEPFARHVNRAYTAATGIEAAVYAVHAAAGAGVAVGE